MKDFAAWVPLQVYWRDARPMVDWGYLGTQRFTEPFYAQTINQCVQHPADLLFRRQTPMAELGELAATQTAIAPTGFIFHMSRCGSTLISQMLAASAANIVISEAGPIDDVLRSRFGSPTVTDEQRVQWLRWLVQILGWKRHASERQLFIKFDCWQVRFLPLIRRAFPEVPWIFLYREPLEVMASAQKQLAGQMIPGVLDPGIFGWQPQFIAGLGVFDYTARVLANICETALAEVRESGGKLVNYQQLPTGVWKPLMEFWRAEFAAEETARMRDAARLDAKNPVLPFVADSQTKRDSATPELRELTRKYLAPLYQQLEAQRSAGGLV